MSKAKKPVSKVTAILGAQWGDEGKGKLIDILSEKYDFIVRATGGANAGHTIYIRNGKAVNKFVFHLVPSGMLNKKPICVIGNGVALHLPTLMEELDLLKKNGIKTEGRLLISNRAHLLFDFHKIVDGLQEDSKGSKKIGTTKRGIGPCYTDKVRRSGIRIHELLDWKSFEEKYMDQLKSLQKMYGNFKVDTKAELALHKKILGQIKPYIIDSATYLNDKLDKGKKVLIEGANGTMLDIDHGTYPFVTSSNASVGGVIAGTGIGATKLTSVIGIMKAYTTRVGEGPFPSELTDALGEQIRQTGGEFGATTGRPRRCGWFDAVIGRYSVMINGFTEINLTKLDVLSGLKKLKIAVGYSLNGKKITDFPASIEDLAKVKVQYIEVPGWEGKLSDFKKFEKLPKNAQKYVLTIEKLIGCRVGSIGTGAIRTDMIFR